MARQRLLGETARARLLGLPAEEREVIRHAPLGAEDLALVLQRRGEANKLGFALMLVCLRHPARALEANEAPPPALLAYLARQLDVDPGAFAIYARRDQTRRTHLAELTRRLGLLAFDRAAFRAMVAWALPLASSMRDPEAMVTLLVEELRQRHILLPSMAVLELIIRTAQRRAETVVHRALTEGLSERTLIALERLVEAGPEAATSQLAWLRTASRSPAARNLLGLVERLPSCATSACPTRCKAPLRRSPSSVSSTRPPE
jgi:TnpA family transposase